jgi:hypothetical protein
MKSLGGVIRGKPTHRRDLGKADEVGEVTGIGTLLPDGIMAQASWERLTEITSGRTSCQQGLAATCKDGRFILTDLG